MPAEIAVKRTRVRPALLAWGALALVVAIGMARMGWWQLDRAEAKQVLLDGIDRAVAAQLQPLAELDLESGQARFRAASVRGEFLADRQVLLDNQTRNGKPGVRAYVPMRPANESRALLVDRGWLPWPDRAQPPPSAAVPGGWQYLEGMLLDPPGAGLQLGAPAADEWPLLVTRIDLHEIEQRLGVPLLDLVLEDRAAPRAESIRAQMLPPERHRGYALQWFGLSLTILIIYAALAWRALRATPLDSSL
jgi:cytochrome oxidase assembly protein ShyY1